MDKVILTTREELQDLINRSLQKIAPHRKDETDFKILTITQASKLLNLAKQTIYGLTSKREIPFFKKGKKIYFHKNELESWIQEGRKLTKSELSKGGGLFR